MKTIAAMILFAAPLFADVSSGFYKAVETGGNVTFKAQVTITDHPTEPGKVRVKVTVNGKSTTTVGTRGAKPNTCEELAAVGVDGGHSLRIKPGRSKPQSKKKGASNLNWKNMKWAQPKANTASAGSDEGVGTLPKGVPTL